MRRKFLHHFQRTSLRLESAGSFPVKVVINTSSLAHLSDYKTLYPRRPQQPNPVAARSKVWVCGHWRAEIVGFESRWGRGWLSVVCCVLSGRGLCNRLIPHPECLCVCVCARARVCVRACQWVWSDATIALYNYSELVEGVKIGNKMKIEPTLYNFIATKLWYKIFEVIKVSAVICLSPAWTWLRKNGFLLKKKKKNPFATLAAQGSTSRLVWMTDETSAGSSPRIRTTWGTRLTHMAVQQPHCTV